MSYGHYHEEGISGYSYPTGDSRPAAWRRIVHRWWPAGLLLGLIALFCIW